MSKKNKSRITKNLMRSLFLLLVALSLLSGCEKTESATVFPLTEEQEELTLTIKGDELSADLSYTMQELASLSDAGFEHTYSTINNWPNPQMYAAKGIRVQRILEEAGLFETAKVITFRSSDSYEASFTKEQLFGPTFYYPSVSEGSEEGAEAVEPILALYYKENSTDLKEATPEDPCLIIGQRNPLEHSNPAFVEKVSEIIVSVNETERWETASTFPLPGEIAIGETVKLQHGSIGIVKLHYTIDGSEPTERSPMYNPSTYQPELNLPIKITEDMTIKVLVSGYGKENSEIGVFEFDAQ